MNLLNFFNTFGVNALRRRRRRRVRPTAAAPTTRASSTASGRRPSPRSSAPNADVIGIDEIENDGYGADSAIQFLVDRLNEATAPGTYAFIDADAGTGQMNALGHDAIKVGLIYKPASVTPIGTTAALNSVAFVNGGDGAPRNRPALAQAFEENATGARVRRRRQPPQEQGQRLRRTRRR